MAGITLAQAEAKLTEYLEAESKVLQGQSYELHGRRLNRANLEEIQAGIKIWDQRTKELAASANGRGRSRIVSPNW